MSSTALRQEKSARRRKRFNKAPVPSIPSKFETLLPTSHGVNKGFGKSSYRFEGDQHVHDLPGPGSYYRPHLSANEDISFSRKGYGAIVSKTERFSRDPDDDEAIPGPGYYNTSFYAPTTSDFSVGGTSAFKCAPRAETAGPFGSKNTPSPGQYDLCKTHTPRYKKSTKSSSFASETKRGWIIKNESPAPGAYKVTENTRWASASGAACAFRSRSQRGNELIPRNHLFTPAPGQYDGMSKPIRPKTEGAKPSSMFANTSLDRFGRPYLRRTLDEETPAPGYYDPQPFGALSKSGAVSAFKTSVRKDREARRAVPGPAYYTPNKVADKRSFHLNSGTHWV